VLEKTVVGIVAAVVVAALGWSATAIVDARANIAVMDARLSQLESIGNVPAQLAEMNGSLRALQGEVQRLREDMQRVQPGRR
jgi:hypothetical protein